MWCSAVLLTDGVGAFSVGNGRQDSEEEAHGPTIEVRRPRESQPLGGRREAVAIEDPERKRISVTPGSSGCHDAGVVEGGT